MSWVKWFWRYMHLPMDQRPPEPDFRADLRKAKKFITKQSNMETQKQNIVPDLINANLNVIEEQVLNKLPEELYKLSKAASDAIGETGVVLFDGNPADGPQVEKIWRKYVNEHLVDFATVKAQAEAEKIGNEILRNLSMLLIGPASDSLKALTDEITDDGAQLKAEWVDFLLTGNNLNLLLDNTLRPLLGLVNVINDSLIDLLISIAADQIRAALNRSIAL